MARSELGDAGGEDAEANGGKGNLPGIGNGLTEPRFLGEMFSTEVLLSRPVTCLLDSV